MIKVGKTNKPTLQKKKAEDDAEKILETLRSLWDNKDIKKPERDIVHKHSISYSPANIKDFDDRSYPSELALNLTKKARDLILKVIVDTEKCKKELDNIPLDSPLRARLRNIIPVLINKILKPIEPDFTLKIVEDTVNHLYKVLIERYPTKQKSQKKPPKYSPSSKQSSSAPRRPARV